MKYLVLTMASSDPGDSDIVEFSRVSDVDYFVQQMAAGGAHKVIVFKKESGLVTDVGGGSVWSPDDEIGGDRLREIGRGARR